MREFESRHSRVKTRGTSSKVKVMRTVFSYIIKIAVIMFVFQSIASFTIVSGHSMNPTLHDGNLLLEEKISKYIRTPDNNDIVIIKEELLGYKIVKRIVGVAGDTVEIKKGIIYVNGKEVSKTNRYDSSENMRKVVVPEDTFFVLGDNRGEGASLDSRNEKVGFISTKFIDGYIIFSLFPFKFIK